jgi:hypothetical protein
MAIERKNTRYGKATPGKVGKEIKLLQLISSPWTFKGQCKNMLR